MRPPATAPAAVAVPGLPEAVRLRDVGPRDGLQAEAPLPPAARAALAQSLFDAGLRRVEAVSFVSPKAVPAMAGPAEVLARLRPPAGATVTALVPNLRGAELALGGGVGELTVTVAVSPAYNERNVHMTIAESLQAVAAICSLAAGDRVPVDAVVSCAFGSPDEGDIPAGRVAELGSRLGDAGVDALTLADTTGMATPRVVAEVLELTGTDVGVHFHDTRGTALVNCYAALQAGVTRFDASVGGLGGSPFAPGAGGNVSTEDLVALLDDLGVRTGVSLTALLGAGAELERLIGRPLPSRVARSGPRLRPGPD